MKRLRNLLFSRAARDSGLVVLEIFTVAVLALIVLWGATSAGSGGRARKIVPAGNGSLPDLEELCAHPGAPDRAWRYIVIHHSATTGGSAPSFERYHTRVRGWDSLAYHFVTGNGTQTGDGVIEIGPRWELQQAGAHTGVPRYNEEGIGICLVGDFTRQLPTERQFSSLYSLVRYLMARYNIPAGDVLGHRECQGSATECPGKNFPIEEFRRSLQ